MAERRAGADKKAPPLTFDNLYKAVEGVKSWRDLGGCLGLSSSELNAIQRKHGSDDLCLKAVVEKFLRGESHLYPHPSWRRVIWTLDNMDETHLADEIIDYGEPVQDPTLTTVNVAQAMELMNDWKSLTKITALEAHIIPQSRLKDIQSKCSTKREIASKCAFYYVHCHPQPSWTHLANHLYHYREFAAVEKLKPFLPLRDLTITTKKLTELLSTMKDHNLDTLGFCLYLPEVKTDEVKRIFHSPSQRREAYLDLFVTDHPCPSWKQIAVSLNSVGLYSQADVVKSAYVQVSERTQRNFDIAMMDGELWIRNGNMFMMGPGGSGKTCTLAAVLEEKPPSIRESTPCAKKPVRAVAQCKIGVSDKTTSKTCFVRITDETYSDMLSTTAKHLPLHTKPTQSSELETDPDQESISDVDASSNCSDSSSDIKPPVLDLVPQCSGFRKELLVRMNAESISSDQLEDKDLFDISDSGGQPMFHEVLPVFVTNTMFGMLTVKLNESLDSHPLVEYYTNGERIGKPFKSPFTHLQTFRHCMRVLQSTCERGKCPKIAFIGTHKDFEHKCLTENRKEKNRKLLSIIPPQMKDSVISCTRESLLFAINAKAPGDDDQAVLTKLRQLLLNELLKVPRVRIPLRYFGLEMAFQRLAKYQKKAILSKEECFNEASTFHFTRESFEDALKYFKGIKLIMYYEDILPDVVFIDAQVLLDKITELVEHSLLIQSESCPPESEAGSVGSFEKFKSCGIITKEILSRFKSHYVPDLFMEDHLILLFKHLLVVAEVGEGEYLMSCLLKEESIPHPLPNSASWVVPPLLFYFGDDGPKLGVYCFLLSSLITEAKWELLMDKGCPVQLSRNQVHFRVLQNHPGFITITDSFSTFFRVDITFPSDISSDKALKICKDGCPKIRETILAGIRNASRTLNYNNSILESAFLCSKHQDDSLHPATISSFDLLTCTSQPATVFSEITESHKLWFGKDPGSTFEAQNTPQSTTSSPSMRLAMDATPTLGKLSLLKTAEGKKIKIIESVAPLWQSLGDQLEFDSSGSKLGLIEATHPTDPKACCRDMFQHWLNGNGVKPCSWRRLIELLEDCDLDDLAAQVRSACSS